VGGEHLDFTAPVDWEKLAPLQGAEGSESVIQRHLQACLHIEFYDPGVLMDADRPEDLQALRERYQSMRSSGNSASDS
jgi:molybdenum cofactor cytidylyltransferase